MWYLNRRLDLSVEIKWLYIKNYCVMMTDLHVKTIATYTCSDPHTLELV